MVSSAIFSFAVDLHSSSFTIEGEVEVEIEAVFGSGLASFPFDPSPAPGVMLVRSAGRRHRRHTARLLAASFAQLNLPWLAPAQLRWSASQACEIPPTSRRTRASKPSNVSQPAAQIRQLATAADQYTSRPPGLYPPPGYSSNFGSSSQDENIPWDFSPNSNQNLSKLRPYDDPIVIDTSVQNPAQKIKVSNGIQGTEVDLLQHLHTSLQVGRLTRAEAIIERLGEKSAPDSPVLLHAHTAYLEESLRTVALHGRGRKARETLEKMQRWFEVEVRSNGVVIDVKMLVVMIRASIKALDGPRRDRTIRRYAELGREMGDDIYEEVLDSEDYDDNEFMILGAVTSYLNEAEDIRPSEELPAQLVSRVAATSYHRGDALPTSEIPNVLSTEQKGEGLANVQRALRLFQEKPGLPADAPLNSQRDRAFERQEIMERTSVDVAVDRWKKADEELRKIGIHTAMQSRPITALMWQWYQALVPILQAELAECRKLLSGPPKFDTDRYHYGPYLELLPVEKIAANTVLHTMTKIATGKNRQTSKYDFEVKLAGLTLGLAKVIDEESKIAALKPKGPRKKAYRSRGINRFRKLLAQQVKDGAKIENESKSAREKRSLLAHMDWPMDIKLKFGAMLVSKLLEAAQLPVTRQHPRTQEKITQMQPAFLHRWKYRTGKKVGLLMPNPALVDKLGSEPIGALLAKRMPMVVQPEPWTEWNKGGYIHYSNPVLRLPIGDANGKDYFLAAYNKGDMGQVFAGLTALGQVPWKIHHGVFKVQVEAWNSGEPVANFAPLYPNIDAPPEPEPSADPESRRKWLYEIRAVEHKRAGLHSKRCFQNFQLEVSRSMVNETLYFPHNMDFRGRAYPIPPYLNHMGADNVRGLLVFAEGKELGPDGLRWLKIHLATVAGHDKASMEERVQFTMSHLSDIYDSVRNPLNGRRWWLQAEDAWQTLCACFELTEALDSPDPNKFLSHLPIQQDGTCNGLQHYAALGGDKVGAAQVNLEPGDRPADVYTAVAEAVKAQVHKDTEAGNQIAQKLDGNITRKCVKQPVMTNVYGVTYYGAKAQVQKQLETIFPDLRATEPINLSVMSQYIARNIFRSLGTMFGGAQAIQHWLGQCADRISTCLTSEQIAELTAPSKPAEEKRTKRRTGTKSEDRENQRLDNYTPGSHEHDRKQQREAKPLFKSTVIWTTPLRLPVVQPYRAQGDNFVRTTLQRISIQQPHVWQPVSKRKQLQAFAPNFIHSLDATHMLLSALKCKEQGMTFASIHDSFWTHACDVGRLSTSLRDAFVEMHSENIVGRLREEFQTRYKGCMYMASMMADSAVGKEITELRKARKTTGAEELALEAERMRLLASEDPEEKAKGKAMVTPGSIFESEGDESAFSLPTEISSQRLGAIPESAGVEATNSDADAWDVIDPTAESEEAAEDVTGIGPDAEARGATETTDFVEEPSKRKPAKSQSPRKYHRKIFLWLPLTFPEVPPRGEFDIKRLHNSRYFFH